MTFHRENSSSNVAETGMEPCVNPGSIAKELTKVEDVLPVPEKNVKNPNNAR